MWSEGIETQVLPFLEAQREQKVFNFGVLGFLSPQKDFLLWKVGDDFDVDAVFDLASLTKCAPTSTLALQQIVAGKLKVDDAVQKWLPELRMSHAEQIKVWHLLTHTLDYRLPMSSLKDLSPVEILDVLFGYEFNLAPGLEFNYGNPASVLLGLLLERLLDDSLSALADLHIFSPLQMDSSTYEPLAKISPHRIVLTERCPWRQKDLRGIVHDESAYALQRPVGSAGVFACATDLLKLLRYYLWENPPLLALVSRNELSHLGGQGTTLGWELSNPRFMGTNVGPQTFGKTGFTGMSMVAEPLKNIGVVWLCDFTWPQREKSVERIFALRRSLHEKIWDI
ncbi:MAG: beta-lactamase family protein [Fibrobacter sp.]|nr:beta-lactamase family protein [Fibrobacter sp.]